MKIVKKLHEESAIDRHVSDMDIDVPVTKQEELLCKYIPDEIEEFCAKNGLEVSCYCSEHQTGEEQHIEIYVGIPEGDDPTDPKYDNIEVNLEMLVNGIGDAENEGEKWGDASFQWISDEEIFGELWPLEQSQVNEVNGWDLEDEDLTLVNSESDGDKLYIVKLWWGSGYVMDCYNAYAFSDEEALNYVVAYIEKTDPESLETVDENANDYLQELVDEGEAGSIEEAYEHPYFQETYLWVDATREGAEQGHYIYNENLTIAEYPKEHDYPLAKGIKRESSRRRTRKVNESSFQVLDADRKSITLSRECPFCHREHHITLDMGENEFYDCLDAMRRGELIQNAFPNLSADEREFIKTGICNQCWDEM